MPYILKQFDIELLRFEWIETFDGVSVEILSINDAQKHLLPLDLKPSNESLLRWLQRRTIPANRAYVVNFLAKLGLNEKNTKGIIDVCKGLSLNDSYWIIPDGFQGAFAGYNLYDNPFSQTLAAMAFTGYGSYRRSSLVSSPEFTTGGMLAKCWRRIDGKILLYKAGTEGFANSGNEPYSEFYAWQVAEAMEIPAIPYGLAKWKGKLCSTCELFTDQNTSYIAIGRLVREGGIRGVMEYYKSLGGEYYEQLLDMLTFDAVICNIDRHFGNFGLLVDNRENRIIRPAPAFDNGLSLFYNALDDDLAEIDKFAKTSRPAAYPDHVLFAKQTMTRRRRDKLRKLVNFRFSKHPRYNLPPKRLKMIEGFIGRRVHDLLTE